MRFSHVPATFSNPPCVVTPATPPSRLYPITRRPARLRALLVQFAPGARTAWHTHPLGQTLYVTQGVGYVALRGQAPQQIRAGDTVWIPPHIEHWHGAAPDHAMAHIAMQEAQNGQVADWLEHVSDADYPSPTAQA